MRSLIRIVLIGDEKSGKSSIIDTMNNNMFSENVGSIVDELSIPIEYTITQIPIFVNDSTSLPEEEIPRQQLMKLSDIIVLVVDASSKTSVDSIFTKWMPLCKRVIPSIPIIIVANKMDLLEGGENKDKLDEVEKALSRSLSEYDNVDVCLKCSAKTILNLDKILYYAEKSVIFPVAPLFDRSTNSLRVNVKCALRRVFRLFNKSRTLLMSDEELNDFQFYCFESKMSNSEISNIRKMLKKQGGSQFVDERTGGITEDGFLNLMQMFVVRDRPETVWMALRKFRYSDNVELPDKIEPFAMSSDQSVEFTSEGRFFLTSLFKTYDADKDGVLTKDEIVTVFAPTKGSMPLWTKLSEDNNSFMFPSCPNNCFSDENNDLTLCGWISEWILMLRIVPELTVMTIVELGFSDDPATLYSISRQKANDFEKYQILRRNVAHAFVFGDKGVGKSSLLRRLLRIPQTTTHVPTMCINTAVAPVKPKNKKSEEKVLILTEVPDNCIDQVIDEHMSLCDIACLMFDVNKPESFTYCKSVQRRLPEGTKILYIANKSDILSCPYELTDLCQQAALYMEKYRLEIPLLTHYTMKDRLFPVVFDCAVYPDICIPVVKEEKKKNSSVLWKLTTVALIMGLIAGGIFIIRKRH